MGYGDYSRDAHAAIMTERAAAPVQKVFVQKSCHALMNPLHLGQRESRDSAEHPNSLGIVFALDVTGSMDSVPWEMAVMMLPRFMKILEACRVRDPQLLFMAVGDATHDEAPLQVGQFESTAQLMDQWLTWSYLEGEGGGNGHESYELALYTLARHTKLDCWEKRGKKGYVFLTGDELPFPSLSKDIARKVLGDRLEEDLTVEEVIAELRETFVPFFIIPTRARRERCEPRWRELLGEHVLCTNNVQDVCYVSAGALCLVEGLVPDLDALTLLFKSMGLEYGDLNSVVGALRPLAKSLGRGGTSSG